MPLPLAQLRGVTPSEGWPDEGSVTAWARFAHLATW
tara:strand:- start:125 stop:232 length:108 start_codon:yes stop_codon:yes gene_type:complete